MQEYEFRLPDFVRFGKVAYFRVELEGFGDVDSVRDMDALDSKLSANFICSQLGNADVFPVLAGGAHQGVHRSILKGLVRRVGAGEVVHPANPSCVGDA